MKPFIKKKKKKNVCTLHIAILVFNILLKIYFTLRLNLHLLICLMRIFSKFSNNKIQLNVPISISQGINLVQSASFQLNISI